MFVFDRDEYFKQNMPLRTDDILLGIEIGLQPYLAKENDKVAEGYPFDYVMGSVHCMNKKDLYEAEAYEELTREEAIKLFLEDSIKCVELHENFDAFGHIDYICRYMPYADKNMYLSDAPELFDKLFKLLIEKNKPLEINTRRLDNKEAVDKLLPLYRRYYELGGRYCTIGSDAHYKEHVGRRLDIATDISREIGLKQVYFKNREMIVLEGL